MEIETLYRGDTFDFDVTAEYEKSKAPYIFEKDEILKMGLKVGDYEGAKYLLYKETKVNDTTDTVYFEFTPEETKKLSTGIRILEVQLTTSAGKVRTIYQENVEIKGDIIND